MKRTALFFRRDLVVSMSLIARGRRLQIASINLFNSHPPLSYEAAARQKNVMTTSFTQIKAVLSNPNATPLDIPS